MLEISKQTARRYVLGRQGLWPGRRWQGPEGVIQAIRAAEGVQVDIISVIARNHDLVLWSRVADYQPEWLDDLLYKERQFFEYGGILFIYPLDEWPYWQPLMARSTRWRQRIREEMPEIIEHVRERIQQDGPLGSRDFKDRAYVPGGFRVVKDVNHGLSYLWITGEVLIHSRRGADRVYELTERLLSQPPSTVSLEEAELYFTLKALRDTALATPSELSRRVGNIISRRPGPAEVKKSLQKLGEAGQVATLTVEGRKEPVYYPASDTALLETLSAGEIPAQWQPAVPTTLAEVNFLAPLDNVIWDRARLLALFDYDYVWEVYKPAPQRRWGYYTLPILYGDRLVARLDPKLDRKTGLFSVRGFWLDEPELAESAEFGAALAAGLRSFATFHQARQLDLGPLAAHPLGRFLEPALADLVYTKLQNQQ